MDVNRQYLRADEVAEMLGMDVSGIYRMCRDRVLPSIRIGAKTVRIPRAGLDAFLARSVQGQVMVDSAMAAMTEDPAEALGRQASAFVERSGLSPHDFVDHWRSGDIADEPQNADLAIEALSLRAALDRSAVAV